MIWGIPGRCVASFRKHLDGRSVYFFPHWQVGLSCSRARTGAQTETLNHRKFVGQATERKTAPASARVVPFGEIGLALSRYSYGTDVLSFRKDNGVERPHGLGNCPVAAHLFGDVGQSLHYIFPGIIARVADKSS